MLITKEHILDFIPQRAPLVMVDNLSTASAKHFETEFHILPDNFFLEDGVLSEFGLVENILQSCAAGLAAVNRSTREEIVNGFVGAVSRMKVHALPNVNDTLHTSVTPLAQLGDWYLAKGEALANGKKLLECEVKIVGRGA